MTEEEIERHALAAAGSLYEGLRAYGRGCAECMKLSVELYNRERWRLESKAREARQAHQREANVLAATAK